jgi:hypothetical protein
MIMHTEEAGKKQGIREERIDGSSSSVDEEDAKEMNA